MTEPSKTASEHNAARRKFLAHCGTFAAATPPAITLLLAQSGRSYAFASSGGIPVNANLKDGDFETVFGRRRPWTTVNDRQFRSLTDS
ncbi:hypothetical protein [uncultured Ferrovibrio sp.]|jgi:hypothetical protein|uniref:hypothetical protein n=1 Tax=uncultured Ferrovibrio sp. TaxID=1576913 RepID=UPI0026050809|nr:hypothetical protein [uncultured Ferrovibrio sp.]